MLFKSTFEKLSYFIMYLNYNDRKEQSENKKIKVVDIDSKEIDCMPWTHKGLR